MMESGALVGLTEVTMRSAILRGNFSASLRLVSSMNCNMKLLRPIDASRSRRSELSKRVGWTPGEITVVSHFLQRGFFLTTFVFLTTVSLFDIFLQLWREQTFVVFRIYVGNGLSIRTDDSYVRLSLRIDGEGCLRCPEIKNSRIIFRCKDRFCFSAEL